MAVAASRGAGCGESAWLHAWRSASSQGHCLPHYNPCALGPGTPASGGSQDAAGPGAVGPASQVGAGGHVKSL